MNDEEIEEKRASVVDRYVQHDVSFEWTIILLLTLVLKILTEILMEVKRLMKV